MARFTSGWVKVQRRIFSDDAQANDFYGDGMLVATWLTLIAWANRQEGSTRFGGKRVALKIGDVVTSQAELAKQLGAGRKVVRRCLDYLVESERISIKTASEGASGGTIITILNYQEYQANEKDEGQLEGQIGASKGPDDGQLGASGGPHIGEEKKRRREEDKNPIGASGGSGGKGKGQSRHPRKKDHRAEAAAIVAKLTSTGSMDLRALDANGLQRLLGTRGAAAYRGRFPEATGEAFLAFWEARRNEGTSHAIVTSQLRDAIAGFLAELDSPPEGAA